MAGSAILPLSVRIMMSIELRTINSLAPRIAALLSSLRLRIRGYVWTEGLAAIVVTLGIAFWPSLAFDWLFEPPWQFRAGMLVVVGAALGTLPIDRSCGGRFSRSTIRIWRWCSNGGFAIIKIVC